MTDTPSCHDRRLALQASFDGTIPKHRLGTPAPPRLPTDAATVMRSIAQRRRKLSADAARSDAALARLTNHLQWMVRNDRARL